jgi:thiol-disulfide isomerase/thioredoxin
LKKQKIKKTEKKVKVEKKPKTEKKEIIHKEKKKSNTFLIIGILIIIILIIGAVIATIVLTKNKKAIITDQDVDHNITITPVDTNVSLTEEEFIEKYSTFMLETTEFGQKIQTELLENIQVKQKPIFDQITSKLNLNKTEIDSCVAENLNLTAEIGENDAKILQKIFTDTQFAQMIGLTGTPAIIINNEYAGGYLTYTELKEKIDAAMDGNVVEDQFYQEGDFFFGSENAKVVVYVYSDYYCGYCKKLAQESLMQLKSEYIDTGKIKYLPKDMISSEPSAAVYANCAGEQGKYFEADLELFNNSSEFLENLQTLQNSILEKYSEDINRINSEYAILQKWIEENPESFSKIQESLAAQAQ